MNKIKIRKATIEDLKAIQNFNLLLFKKEKEEYDPFLDMNWTFGKEGTKYYKEKIGKDDNCAFVATVDDKVIGYLVGGIVKAETYRKLPPTAELENTFVLDDYRNFKIGANLYLAFMKWCKEKGVKIIRVQASAPNLRAINFYRKNGFKDYTLILEHYLEDGKK